MKYIFFLFCLLTTQTSHSVEELGKAEAIREFGSMFDLKKLERSCHRTGSTEDCFELGMGLAVHDTQKNRRTLLFKKGCEQGHSYSCSALVDEMDGLNNFEEAYNILDNKFRQNNEIVMSQMSQLLYYKLRDESLTGITSQTRKRAKDFISKSCRNKARKGCEIINSIIPYISNI
ncbi:hypothetical protein [Halobacteriovorax sp. HLS]|uniref:hypothetical protein n=1 Tax=Halobacteriovorax sp. HLS TaxID=2234000 RepID=UPI000FD7F291|nr:hypothetical protein [Halobacteriovorax sp. HLS]